MGELGEREEQLEGPLEVLLDQLSDQLHLLQQGLCRIGEALLGLLQRESEKG